MERKPVSRSSVCPFLLRVFWREDSEVPVEALQSRGHEQGPDELRLHTWKDATLRELIEQLKEHLTGARRRDAQFSFALVRQSREGAYVKRDVGIVHAVRRGDHDLKTLEQLKHVIGDYLAVSISYQLH